MDPACRRKSDRQSSCDVGDYIQGDYLRHLTNGTTNHEETNPKVDRSRTLPNSVREYPRGDGGENPTEIGVQTTCLVNFIICPKVSLPYPFSPYLVFLGPYRRSQIQPGRKGGRPMTPDVTLNEVFKIVQTHRITSQTLMCTGCSFGPRIVVLIRPETTPSGRPNKSEPTTGFCSTCTISSLILVFPCT